MTGKNAAMNKNEYWFLEAAIRLKIPFPWLSAGNVDELLTRPHHHLSRPELLIVLERLFARGDLFLEYVDRHGQSERRQAPSRSEIEAALYSAQEEGIGPPERLFYGVTAQGGALWERHSHPQWDLFFEEGYGIDPYEGEMAASTPGLIEERLGHAPYDTMIKAIVPESLRWSVLQPWQATYWKQLPLGYRVEFTYLPLSEGEERTRPAPPDWVGAWRQRVRKWYTSYLETEG